MVYLHNIYSICQPLSCFTFDHPNWSEILSLLSRVVTCNTVRVKKNATQRHLKTWRHVRHFSPTKSAALRWPRRGAPSCKAPQCNDCGAFCRKNAARLPNCSTFGKKRRNPYPSASRTNPEANHKSVARVFIKKRQKFGKKCCILFDVYQMCPSLHNPPIHHIYLNFIFLYRSLAQ